MKVIHTNHRITKELNLEQYSIFLAGPSPRSAEVISWRIEALEALKRLGYDGQVLIPESDEWKFCLSYDDQVEWEDYGLLNCDKIVFWIPRNMVTLPGLTTNVEFGRFVHSGRMIYGRPDEAEKCIYLDWLYTKYNNRAIYTTLEGTMKAAIR